MKTLLIFTGKTADKDIAKLTDRYLERLGHYIQISVAVVPDLKNTAKLTEAQVSEAEGVGILKLLKPDDYVVLLDERGREYRSVEFAARIGKLFTSQGSRRLVFVIGGPYGFSPQVQAVASERVSLSKMTFSHQMVRLIFAEQLYRAMTILRHEPYHHE